MLLYYVYKFHLMVCNGLTFSELLPLWCALCTVENTIAGTFLQSVLKINLLFLVTKTGRPGREWEKSLTKERKGNRINCDGYHTLNYAAVSNHGHLPDAIMQYLSLFLSLICLFLSSLSICLSSSPYLPVLLVTPPYTPTQSHTQKHTHKHTNTHTHTHLLCLIFIPREGSPVWAVIITTLNSPASRRTSRDTLWQITQHFLPVRQMHVIFHSGWGNTYWRIWLQKSCSDWS